jgi:hypothetical protein
MVLLCSGQLNVIQVDDVPNPVTLKTKAARFSETSKQAYPTPIENQKDYRLRNTSPEYFKT